LPVSYFKMVHCHDCSRQLAEITAAWRKTLEEGAKVVHDSRDSHLSGGDKN